MNETAESIGTKRQARWRPPWWPTVRKAEPRLGGLVVKDLTNGDVVYPWSRVDSFKHQNWGVFRTDGTPETDDQRRRIALCVDGTRERYLAARLQRRWIRRGLDNGGLRFVARFGNLRWIALSAVVAGIGYAVYLIVVFGLPMLRFLQSQEYELMPEKGLYWFVNITLFLTWVALFGVGACFYYPMFQSNRAKEATIDQDRVEVVLVDGRSITYEWKDLLSVGPLGRLRFRGGWEVWLSPPAGRVGVLLGELRRRLTGEVERTFKAADMIRMSVVMIVVGIAGTIALLVWPPPDRNPNEIILGLWGSIALFSGIVMFAMSRLPKVIEQRLQKWTRARQRAKRLRRESASSCSHETVDEVAAPLKTNVRAD